MAENMSEIKPFESGHARARRTIVILTAGIALDLGLIGENAIEGVLRFMGYTDSSGVVDLLLIFAGFVGLVQQIVYPATVVLFSMWIHRAHRNLPALGAIGLRYSPGWAVGGFFIPILNLFIPYSVVNEIWKASDLNAGHNDYSWQDSAESNLVKAWWVSWIFINALDGVYPLAILSMIQDRPLLLCLTSILVGSLDILLAVLAIKVVRAIDNRQEEKSKRVSAFETLPGTVALA